MSEIKITFEGTANALKQFFEDCLNLLHSNDESSNDQGEEDQENSQEENQEDTQQEDDFSNIPEKEGVYYVSSSEGNDNNSGLHPDKAWKSLEKVNNFVFNPGDQILFKTGDSWEGIFNVNKSGTANNHIIYKPYGSKEKPQIYGSKEITGWKLYMGNIYKASVSDDITQLFIDGRRMKIARCPDKGYININKVNSSNEFSGLDLYGGVNYERATWIGRTSAYTLYSRDVTGSSGQTITLESRPTYGLGTGEGFFLVNKLAFLDRPGEWCYDPATKTVYFWTPNGDSPNNYTVRGSVHKYGIDISNKSYIEIKNLQFLHNAENGINIKGGSNIRIDSNDVVSPDYNGIHAHPGSDSVTVINNYIYQANTNAIKVYGSDANISDNIIEDTGLLENINKFIEGGGIAIKYRGGNNSTINHNRIINCGYNGIYFQGKNTMVKYNFIDGACQVLDDGGGIYTYNAKYPDYSAGSEVMHNIVINVHGNADGVEKRDYGVAYGIYMDNKTTDVLVKNNTVAHAACGLYVHETGNITLQHNTVFDTLCGCRASKELSNSYIYDNIFFAFNRNGDFVWWSDKPQVFQVRDSSSPIYDRNKYYHSFNDKPFRWGSPWSFEQWKSRIGQDKNSIFKSPTGIGELFYNDTKEEKEFFLTKEYEDLEGNHISRSIILQPFESKILIVE